MEFEQALSSRVISSADSALVETEYYFLGVHGKITIGDHEYQGEVHTRDTWSGGPETRIVVQGVRAVRVTSEESESTLTAA